MRKMMASAFVPAMSVLLLVSGTASAQNATYQNFFTAVCTGGGAAGALATRCGQTPGGGGNISGDSEVSLNPGQTLSSTDAGIARAQASIDKAEQRSEEQRKQARGQTVPGFASGSEGAMEFGRFSLLVNLRGEDSERTRDRNENEVGYEGDAYAGEVGLDYRVTDRFLIGGLLGFERSQIDFDASQPGNAFTPAPNQGGIDEDNYSLTVFASLALGEAFYVDGSLSYGYSDYDFRRNDIFQESTRVAPQTNIFARGDSSGEQYSASIGGGYDFYRDAFSVGPYARLNWVRSTVDGYVERDSANTGLALRVGDTESTSVTSVLGVQASCAISGSFGVLVPQVRVEYEHEFDNDPNSVTTSFIGDASGTSLTVRSDEPDRDYFNLGLSIVAVLPNGWQPYVDFEYLAAYSDYERRRLTAGMRIEF